MNRFQKQVSKEMKRALMFAEIENMGKPSYYGLRKCYVRPLLKKGIQFFRYYQTN